MRGGSSQRQHFRCGGGGDPEGDCPSLCPSGLSRPSSPGPAFVPSLLWCLRLN